MSSSFGMNSHSKPNSKGLSPKHQIHSAFVSRSSPAKCRSWSYCRHDSQSVFC
ncbi:unnamed protein product [Brassica rapa subsp. narinosa]